MQRERNLRLLIDALDLLEECRALTSDEAELRSVAIKDLDAALQEKLEYWRRRYHIKVAIQGDANTQFFHANASGRLRRNTIQVLTHDGIDATSHASKAAILLDYYTNLLGVVVPSTWSFNLNDLYPTVVVVDSLSSPFSQDEIRHALFGMNTMSSPGPDGFEPSFYRSFWKLVEPDVLTLFANFYEEKLDLDGINRAVLVLLPQKEGARTADSYRPISLQNCPIKMFTKVMTNRLQPRITSLVDDDQTGFIKGRCISENFVYAPELLSCCYKRKAPTLVMKLDFRKAFDSVNWSSLDHILQACGFSDI